MNNSDVINVSNTKSSNIVYNIDKEILEKEPFDEKYYITDMNKTEMIKYFEKEIRDSFEYKFLIDIFKTVLDVKSCVYFKGFSLENGMKLEFHHHPFTLYDYVEAVVNKQTEENKGFVYENDVERETSLLHYKLMVGLVPLDPTAHAQVHDGLLDIHPDLVIGNYEKFVEEYKDYIPEGTMTKYNIYKEKYHNSELEYPENFKYKPTVINASNKNLITIDKIDQFLISDKIQKVNNKSIEEMINKKEEK